MFDSGNFDFSQGIVSVPGTGELPCFCCGICCSKYYIRITLDEALGIAARLDVIWDEWLKYTDPVHSNAQYHVLRRPGGKCVFLDYNPETGISVCRIHQFKPTICGEWVSSLYQPDCREGLSRDWGLGVTPQGEPEGSPGKLRAFYDFLKKLTA